MTMMQDDMITVPQRTNLWKRDFLVLKGPLQAINVATKQNSTSRRIPEISSAATKSDGHAQVTRRGGSRVSIKGARLFFIELSRP